MKNVVIIGGGIAGLLSAIQLARAGIECTVVEKKNYPFHRVCGEYISNETTRFLKSLGLYPGQFDPPQISRFTLSAVNGKHDTIPLDLGGFGISRFTFDNFLFEEAKAEGVKFLLGTEVTNVEFFSQSFLVLADNHKIQADLVIGAFGKRSKVDVALDRNFIHERSPYVGVKYHIRTDHKSDLIALHNFKGGYCGISNIEDGKTNLCYLTHRDNLKKYRNIREMEQAVLYENPHIREIFTSADFLFEKPEVINEISFRTKQPVEGYILMSGDAAGMITPLCGNGMAMAMHSSKVLTPLIIQYFSGREIDLQQLQKAYTKAWRKLFAHRLWEGRQIQNLFGSPFASNLAVNLALRVKPVAKAIVRRTHGEVF